LLIFIGFVLVMRMFSLEVRSKQQSGKPLPTSVRIRYNSQAIDFSGTAYLRLLQRAAVPDLLAFKLVWRDDKWC
jgi:hypothetical protein